MELDKLSVERLVDVDVRLVDIVHIAHSKMPCKVLEGFRGEAAQNQAFNTGHSKVKWPDGRHNKKPSVAVDAAQLDRSGKVNWNIDTKTKEGRDNLSRYYFFAGYLISTADSLGTKIRWGGDWNSDTFFDDQKFNDLVHFELVEE